MIEYFWQMLGHWQHGIGKFEYESKKAHELNRIEREELGDCWYGCCCEDCDFNRFNSVLWFYRYSRYSYALAAFKKYHHLK